jgi:RimJ/RimL family protein N-acetyltransferase
VAILIFYDFVNLRARIKDKMIQLRSIKPEDITETKKWPPYGGGFEQMNYALRDNGWLDEFKDRPGTWIYAVALNDRMIGFSLLSVTDDDAEFRIAIHPDWTGKGMGRKVTLATLKTGFRHLNLDKIHLIVRKNNPLASKLYTSIGFVTAGESVHTIQGKVIEFIDMNMSKEQFNNLKIEDNA